MASKEDIARLQAIYDADPELQRRVAAYAKATENMGIGPKRMQAMRHSGISAVRKRLGEVPEGYYFDIGSGQIKKDEGIPAWAWALPAIGVAAPFVAPALAGLGGAGGAAGAGAATTAGAGAAGAAAAKTGVSAVLGRLGSSVALKAMGAGLGAASESAASNRSTTAELIAQEEILNQRRREAMQTALENREADRQASGKTAFRELQHADYLANGGNAYKAKPGVPSYGIGPKAATTAEIAAAEAYRAENKRRLDAGESLIPAPVDRGEFELPDDVMKAGKMERLTGYGSTILGILGALRK